MCDLSINEQHMVKVIAAEFKKDLVAFVHDIFRAGDELAIDHNVVSVAITIEALALAAFLHSGSDASFFRMAHEAFAAAHTGETVQ